MATVRVLINPSDTGSVTNKLVLNVCAPFTCLIVYVPQRSPSVHHLPRISLEPKLKTKSLDGTQSRVYDRGVGTRPVGD